MIKNQKFQLGKNFLQKVYLTISYNNDLTSSRRLLESADRKQIHSDTLIELAEIVLKKHI